MHKAFAKPIQVEHRRKEELKSPIGGHLRNGGTALQESGPTTSEVGIQRVASFNKVSMSKFFSEVMNNEACDDDTLMSDLEFPPTTAATQKSFHKNRLINHE
jgi:hypothetical protein